MKEGRRRLQKEYCRWTTVVDRSPSRRSTSAEAADEVEDCKKLIFFWNFKWDWVLAGRVTVPDLIWWENRRKSPSFSGTYSIVTCNRYVDLPYPQSIDSSDLPYPQSIDNPDLPYPQSLDIPIPSPSNLAFHLYSSQYTQWLTTRSQLTCPFHNCGRGGGAD